MSLSIPPHPVRPSLDKRRKEDDVKIIALIYGDEEVWESLSDEEGKVVDAKHRKFQDSAGSKIIGGAELAFTRSATTVRVRDGETIVSDGPFAETKEQLGGFYLLDCEGLDEATELAAQIPEAATWAVEVRAEHWENAA
jgi:hypothetical protein